VGSHFLGMSKVGLYLALANDKTVRSWIEEDLSKSTGYSGRLRIGDPEIDNLTMHEINIWIGAHKWLAQKRPVLKDIICDEWEYCSRHSEYGDDHERLITDLAQQIKDVVGAHLASLVATILFKESLISFCMCENIQRLMREAIDAYYNQKRYDDHTFELFARIIQADPNNHLAYHHQGSIKLKQGRYEEAILHDRRALVLNPTEPTYWNSLGYAYAYVKSDLETASNCITYALHIVEDDDLYNRAACLDSLGWVLCQCGKYAEALKYLSESLELLRRWKLEIFYFGVEVRPEVLYHIAEAYRGLGDNINLHKTINEIQQTYPKSIWAKRVESLRTPEMAMADSDFAASITIDFFFELVETCNLLYEQDPSLTLPYRAQRAIELPSLVPHIDEICLCLSNKDLLKDGLSWLIDVLGLFSVDRAQKSLSHAKMAHLHYLRYSDSGAAWHNLRVNNARRKLLLELEEILQMYFLHWERKQISERLKTVPPLVLLEGEFTPLEKEIRSALSLDFVVAFLKSTFIIHLGIDPLPDQFPRIEEQTADSKAKSPDELKERTEDDVGVSHSELMRMLRSNRPRYTTASHTEFFQRVRSQPPFSEVYSDVFTELDTICSDRVALENALLSLTFRLSLPYAHAIVNSREFIESMSEKGPLLSIGRFTLFTLWTIEYDDYLQHFRNPEGWRLRDIACSIPLSVELFSLIIAGSYDEELHTPLDSIQPAPDEEFDDD